MPVSDHSVSTQNNLQLWHGAYVQAQNLSQAVFSLSPRKQALSND